MVSKGVAVVLVLAAALCIAGGSAYVFANGNNNVQQQVYSITYELNGGVADVDSPISYVSGSTVDLGIPTKISDGHECVFLGWFTDETLTRSIEKITPSVSGDLKLYASWSGCVYSIEYDLNGGTADENSPDQYVSGTGTELVTPVKTSDGHDVEFLGWYLDKELTQKKETIASSDAGDIKLYASWGGVIYSITYELNGGTADENAPDHYVSGTGTELTAPTKYDGSSQYAFLGWYLDKELTQRKENISPSDTGDIKLYASWGGAVYSITYVLNGGTADLYSPASYQSGTVTDLGCPANDDLTFIGWYLDAECTDSILFISEEMSGDLTLYALWDDSLVGHGYQLKVTGKQTEATRTRSYTGTYSSVYLNFDDEKGSLTHTVYYLTDYYGRYTYDDVIKWNPDEDEFTVTVIEDVTVTVGDWTTSCDAVTMTSNLEKYTETQYIIYGWLPVKIESTSVDSSVTTKYVYTLADVLKEDVTPSFTVTAYAEKGISVESADSCEIGQYAAFTAILDDGVEFKGWYDSDGNLLSSNLNYTVDMVLSDITVYAYNASGYDYKYTPDNEFVLTADPGLTDVEWSLKNYYGTIIDTQTGPTFSYTFTEMSEYTIWCSGSTGSCAKVNTFCILVTDGSIQRTIEWSYGDHDYSITLDIKYYDYFRYRSDDIERCQGTMEHNMEFVTYEDEYVVQIAEYINGATVGLTDSERVNVLLVFTQVIPYKYDSESKGQEEYWKYPVETLYENNGDCEDTSILFCAIGTAMGYDTAFMLFSGHAVAAINIEDLGYDAEANISSKRVFSLFGNNDRYYFTDGDYVTYAYRDTVYDKTRYYLYCETTLEDYPVGQVPYYERGTYSSSYAKSVCPILAEI